jgi:hypothetical protein
MSNIKHVTDFDQLYPGRFLKAGELGDTKPTLTIDEVFIEELEGDKGKKWKGVVKFSDSDKEWALNKTNGICLREMFGRSLPEWKGHRVTLFAGTHDGEPALRVWGSPELERDTVITIQLPRKKPTKMTMHATGGGKKAAQTRPAAKPEPVVAITASDISEATGATFTEHVAPHQPPPKFKYSPRGRELLIQMRDTATAGMMAAFPIAIDADDSISDEEKGQLLQMVEKRRQQLHLAVQQVASDDIPY